MMKQNRWLHGVRDFAFPHLPESQKGRHGCQFLTTTFDTVVGDEVYVVFMEEPEYVKQYAQVSPFNLLATTGLVRTPHGIVAYVVWRVAAGSPQEVLIEHYLNPHLIETLHLVSSAANQSDLKFLIINNRTGETGAFFHFKNTFVLDQLATAMILAIGHETEGDFHAAIEHVKNTMTIDDLLGLSIGAREGAEKPSGRP